MLLDNEAIPYLRVFEIIAVGVIERDIGPTRLETLVNATLEGNLTPLYGGRQPFGSRTSLLVYQTTLDVSQQISHAEDSLRLVPVQIPRVL